MTSATKIYLHLETRISLKRQARWPQKNRCDMSIFWEVVMYNYFVIYVK